MSNEIRCSLKSEARIICYGFVIVYTPLSQVPEHLEQEVWAARCFLDHGDAGLFHAHSFHRWWLCVEQKQIIVLHKESR